jgi:hypothetical protein
MEKVAFKIWATSVIIKTAKVDIRPMGENSPNLITLIPIYIIITPALSLCLLL